MNSSAETYYDDLEIFPVCYLEEHDCYETCEPEAADTWSLYGHLNTGGVECIGDFASFEAAAEVRRRLEGLVAAVDLHALLAARRQIAAIWGVEDVRQVRPDLNDDQAYEVLRAADRAHDSTFGLNWQTIEDAAEALFPRDEDATG